MEIIDRISETCLKCSFSIGFEKRRLFKIATIYSKSGANFQKTFRKSLDKFFVIIKDMFTHFGLSPAGIVD